MKLFYLAIGAAALCISLPQSAFAADRSYDLPAFTAIEIASGIDATVTVGGAQNVAATARDAETLDRLKVDVRDGTLKIWREGDLFDLFESFGDGLQTRFTISAPALAAATSSSGADVDVSGLGGDRVRLKASSGADLKATDIQATAIDVDVSSGADLTANGTCTTLSVEASSGSSVEIDNLACTDAVVNTSSGSDVSLRASGRLDAKASSGADVSVHGQPKTTTIENSSGGSVTLGD